jgi:hypothetical protein
VAILNVTKVAESGFGSESISQRYESADPDQYQNVTTRNTAATIPGSVEMVANQIH